VHPEVVCKGARRLRRFNLRTPLWAGNFILKTAVQTAAYAKYAKGKRGEWDKGVTPLSEFVIDSNPFRFCVVCVFSGSICFFQVQCSSHPDAEAG